MDPLYFLQQLHIGNRKEIYRMMTGDDNLYNDEKKLEEDEKLLNNEQ